MCQGVNLEALRRAGLLSLLLLITAVLAPVRAAMSESADREDVIKAAVVFKLAKFVEWPAGTFEQADTPLKLCVLGQSPVADALGTAAGRRIHDREVTVQQVARLDAAGTECHVVFIPASEKDRLAGAMAWLVQRPILSVSDIDHFARRGGIVGLKRRGARLGFEVNLESVKHAGLVISAPLLELADIIESPH